MLEGYDFSTLAGGTNNFGPSPYAATTTATGIQNAAITRGSGVSTTGTGASKGLGGTGFSTTATTEAAAIAANNFFTISLGVATGNTASLSSIDAFNLRRSASGPSTAIFQYAVGAGAYSDIGSAFTIGSVTTSAGNPEAAISLSGITALQNLAGGTTVNFRLVEYGATGSGGTFYLNDKGNTTANDFTLSGTVMTGGGTAPTSFAYFDLNASTPGSGIANNSTNTFSGTHFNTTADGTGTTGAFTNDGTATATFSAGTDSAANAYTVNIDQAVNTAGIAFKDANVTLVHATGGSITLASASINVVTGAAAAISEAIGGTVGLTKDGTGTLTLSGTNGYSGSTTINAGILSVSNDANLGTSTNGVVLASGTLQTTANLPTSRAFTGTGSLDIASGTTLTASGVFNTTAVTLANTGTLAITSAGAGQAIGNVTFNATATVANTGSALAVGNVTVASGSTGVATLAGPVSLASGTHTFTVPDTNAGGVDLSLTGSLSGAGTLSKATGAGTLSLSGDNSGYTGTITLGGTTTTGGTISVGNATALGTSTAGTPNATTGIVTVTGALNFDTGTLSNDTGGLVTTSKALSIGALTTGPGAVLAGSDFNFTSNVALYKGSSTQTAQQSLVVNNNTTISGNFTTSTGQGTSTGLTVSGTGALTLTGANTFVEPLTISGVTLNAASTTGKALGGNTALNVTNGGTLVLATANQANPGAGVGLNASTLRVNASQGSGATLSGGAVSGGSTIGLGALTLTANSTLNYGNMAATAVFLSFAPGSFVLNVTGTNFGTATDSADGVTNRLIFNQDISAAGFLGNITFNGVSGATETLLDTGFYEITPAAVPEPATVLGGVLMVGLLGWNQRRRLRGLKSLAA